MIRLRGLKLSYDTGFSLEVDSLDVRRGEIFAVIGPNGAGKTTLL
ncbi:MAG TPA: multidrug ABC transporter ATP-binding protein, partial [Elusimicrobia bacterium]|nr:multidrug ABC transporter ATP-binding protein [Elusimicrobiota bacterium]